MPTTVRCSSHRALVRLALVSGLAGVAGSAAADGPSFSCGDVRPGSIEEVVCKDDALATLDRQLSEVYAAASQKAVDQQPPTLKSEQRGWIKGRDECWKSDDTTSCVRDEYQRRIAELQARYRLLPARGPVTLFCDGNERNEIVVSFFQTDPPTLIAERGDSVSLMFRQPSASGAKYRGRNEMLWDKGGEATVQWGYDAPEMRCEQVREAPDPVRR